MRDKVDQRFFQNKGDLMGMFTTATGAPLCPHFLEILFIYIYIYISLSLCHEIGKNPEIQLIDSSNSSYSLSPDI